jgi:hypothetical protein
VKTFAAAVRIAVRGGLVRVHGWPGALQPPFGLAARGAHLEGPARLRWRVRAVLDAAGHAYADDAAGPEAQAVASAAPAAEGTAAPALLALAAARYRGLACGVAERERAGLVAVLGARLACHALVLAPDSAAEHRWRRELPAADVLAVAAARGALPAHELLVVDAPEAMPWPQLGPVLDGSPALARVGLPARIDWRLAERLAPGLGPVVHVTDPAADDEDGGGPHCHELRVALPDDVATAYEATFATFLAAFDRFAAARPGTGFGTFVAQARDDPRQRPALSAWHTAIRLAAWHEPKRALVGELLARHRGERVLVFTPHRAAAYELAQEHLIAALTAELPRRERDALLDAFANGELRALAGPRLLDHGVAAASADVAILCGGGFGAEQRRARCRRVAAHGVVYELVSLDTVEVGRARRWRGGAAAGEAAVHAR